MKKILCLGVILFCFFNNIACRDYGYDFYLDVEGEGGHIHMMYYNEIYEPLPDGEPYSFLGGENTYYFIIFVATPDEGYQVKQWTFNGEIVEDHRHNIFMLLPNAGYEVRVTVEFEPIEPIDDSVDELS